MTTESNEGEKMELKPASVAIISLGGKQHLVSQGASVVVNQLSIEEGNILKLPDLLSGQIVQAKIRSHQLGKKINALKFKAKTRSFKRYGHRQRETTVEIVSIGSDLQAPKTSAARSVVKKTLAKRAAVSKITIKNSPVGKEKVSDDTA